jgi:hypothetical protein
VSTKCVRHDCEVDDNHECAFCVAEDTAQAKADPRPGDEFLAPKLKAKVVSVLVGESGTEKVSYKIAYRGEVDYGKHVCTATITQFKRLVASDGVIARRP